MEYDGNGWDLLWHFHYHNSPSYLNFCRRKIHLTCECFMFDPFYPISYGGWMEGEVNAKRFKSFM